MSGTKRPDTVCLRWHQHKDWMEAFTCSFDSLSPRDADGRVIESPAPPAEQPIQAALGETIDSVEARAQVEMAL